MEKVVKDKTVGVKLTYSPWKLFRNTFILILAILAGYLHYSYVKELHENWFHFSHLSTLERELTLRTEMGFYYHYYKTIVQERPFAAAISKLMYDRTVEYPKEVNAFNRFNIHPEVILGAIYRYSESWLLRGDRECHLVHRGEGLPPVESCVGLREPILFYLEGVWLLAGLVVAGLFLSATTLSGSITGGVLAVCQYFANHSSASRVWRAPNERENLALPLLVLQGCLLTHQLRATHAATHTQVSIFIMNCLCLLFWQFSQFVFLTQTAILFVMEQLRIIDIKTFCVFLHAHFCGLHMAVLLLQGNDMLKSSMYTSFFLVVSAYCLFFSSMRIKVRTTFDFFVEAWLVILRICIVICASWYLKRVISDFLGTEDDDHIWELLLAKFTDYKSFHTLMYTCIDVFDFLPVTYFKDVSKTLLLPLTLYACVSYCLNWISEANLAMKYEYNKGRTKTDETETLVAKDDKTKDTDSKMEATDSDDSGIENNAENVTVKSKLSLVREEKDSKNDEVCESDFVCFVKCLRVDPAVFYAASQMVVYCLLAILFMRLKLLFTTQMCIVCSLVVNVKMTFGRVPCTRVVFWMLASFVIARGLFSSVRDHLAVKGEFSDRWTEELVSWAAGECGSKGAVFACSLPVAATLLLSARCPVVSHPHYEHKDARARAMSVHKVYGRFTAREVYEELSQLRATHLVLETTLCYGATTQGCTLLSIWDAQHPPPAPAAPQLCGTLLSQPHADHLYRVFSNQRYTVYRVHDISVRYMPRVFDT